MRSMQTRLLQSKCSGTRLAVLVLFACGAGALGCAPSRPKIEYPPNLSQLRSTALYVPNVHRFQTTTGMTVMVLPERNTNLVKIDVRYQVGAAEDPPGKAGLAHLVEHLLFEARLAGPETPSLGKLMSSTALYQNAYTIWDETQFSSIAFADELAALLSLEARRMGTSCDRILEEDFVREREVVLNEVRQRSSVAAATNELLRAEVYGRAHPYARDVGGTEQEVARITRDDVCAFLDRHYGPSAAILVVSGNVEPGQVVSLINQHFRGLPERQLAPRAMIRAPQGSVGRRAHVLPVDEASVLIAFPTAPFLSDEAVYERLLMQLLDEHLSAVVRDRNDITAFEVGMSGGLRAPLLVVSLSVATPDELDGAISFFFREVTRITSDLDDDTLGALLERKRTELLFAVEPFMSKSSMVADYIQYAPHHEMFAVHELQTLGNVRRVGLEFRARRLFARTNARVIAIRPQPGVKPTAERAQVQFLASTRTDEDDHEEHVDPAEAEAPLAISERRIDTQIRSFTLANGLRVLLAPQLSHPVVDIRMVFPAGELHDPPDKPGLSFLALHLLEPSEPEIERPRDLRDLIRIYRMGGKLSRYMDERTTTFRTTGLAPHVDGLLWNLYWLLDNGIYTGESVSKVRKLLGREAADEEIANKRRMQAVLQTLYGAGHPYVAESLTGETAQRISRSDLERFRDTHYRMHGATLIITGSFDASVVEAEVNRLFSHWKRTAAPERRQIPAAAPRKDTQYLAVLDEDARRVRIVLAFDTAPGFTTQRGARMVLREMLRSELWLLRDELGITYNVDVSQITREGPGMLMISTEIDREHAAEAFRVIQETIANLRAGKHTAAFVRARRHVLQQLLADALSSTSVASELETIVTYDLPRSYYDELPRQVATLRPADLQALIDRELAPAHQVVLAVGDSATIKALYQATGISKYRLVQ